jgi:hypothetical protein
MQLTFGEIWFELSGRYNFGDHERVLMPRQTATPARGARGRSGTAGGSPTCEPEGLYWGDLVTLKARHLDPHAEIKKYGAPVETGKE